MTRCPQMSQRKVSRVQAALAALAPPGDLSRRQLPTIGRTIRDASGISSGDPDTYIDVFRFLLCRYWNVVGDDFFRSQTPGGLTGCLPVDSSPLGSIDVVLGLAYDACGHGGGNASTQSGEVQRRGAGVAFRRIVRFNREVLGMTKTYLLEAQFVKPHGFRERKLDMVLDMVDALRLKEKEWTCDQGVREGRGGRVSGEAVREGEVTGRGRGVVPRPATAVDEARVSHVMPRASLPHYMVDGKQYKLPDVCHEAVERRDERVGVCNPLFSLDVSSVSPGTLDGSPGSMSPCFLERVAYDVDVPLGNVSTSTYGNEEGAQGREEADANAEVFDSLLGALQHRVASVRQILLSTP